MNEKSYVPFNLVAEQTRAAKETEEQLCKAGLVQTDAKAQQLRIHAETPLPIHLAVWRQSMLDRQRDPRYVADQIHHVTRLFEMAGIRSIDQIEAERVQAAASRLLDEEHLAPRTVNAAITAARMFSRWLKRTGRLADHPLEFMTRYNEELDTRRRRRALSLEELAELVKWTPSNRKNNRTGIPPGDIAMLYQVASWTGFRQRALRHLEKADFVVGEEVERPGVRLLAKFNKKGRERFQPLRPDQAAAIRQWLAARPEGPVWPIKPHVDLALRMRSDLAFARQQWIASAPSAKERKRREESDFLLYQDRHGRYADFHSLRHTRWPGMGRSRWRSSGPTTARRS